MKSEDVPAELVEAIEPYVLDGDLHKARRALAAVLPLAEAEALEEAADEMYGDKRASGPFAHPLSVMTWLRERAARLREGSPS